MPDRREQRIDEELRAYAEARRRQMGDPLELHSAARRQLQDEVARAYGTREAPQQTSWWAWILTPRTAVGVAAAAVVCCVVAIVGATRYLNPAGPARGEVELARLEVERAARDRAAVPSAAPVLGSAADENSDARKPEPAVAVTKLRTAVDSPRPEPRVSAPPGAAVLERAVAPSLSESRESMEQARAPSPSRTAARFGLAEKLAPESAPAEGAVLPRGLAGNERALAKAEDGPAALAFDAASVQNSGAQQRFAQVDRYRRNFNSPPLPPVLQNFELQQNDTEIVIVDADGSIYRGGVEAGAQAPADAVSASSRQDAGRQEPASLATPALQAVSATGLGSVAGRGVAMGPASAGGEAVLPVNNLAVAFRVQGTNRTLNQLVVFEGSLMNSLAPGSETEVQALQQAQLADPAALTNQAGGVELANARRAQPMILNQLVNQAVRVQGRALVGPTTRLEIDAAPSPR